MRAGDRGIGYGLEQAGQLDLFSALPERTEAVKPPISAAVKSAPAITPIAVAAEPPALMASPATLEKATSKGGIEDAGAELVANRRNRVLSAKTWADLSPLNPALRVKETVKANVWLKPDYKQLIADGMPPMVAHIVKQVYDSVAAKPTPARSGVLDDERLETYVRALNKLEAGVMRWATDREALALWAKANARVAGAMLGRPMSMMDLASKEKTLLDVVYPEGHKAARAEILIAGGNKVLGALQPGYDEIRRATKAMDAGWPEKREAWEVQGYHVNENPEVKIHETMRRTGGPNSEEVLQFYVSVDRRQWPLALFDSREQAERAVAELKTFVLVGKRGVVDTFASHEDAVQAAKDRTGRDKGAQISEKGAKVEDIAREGKARRLEEEDISSERLMMEFGFKGVNFGNWMKTPSARAEAQLHLNHSFDSLHDLADVLGVPPQALSLNGMLGLAIGAQGAGGTAAAHFVPGVNEINLTRTSGAGSLAHEWAHAVDHYYAVQASLATATEPFLTEHASLEPTIKRMEFENGKWVPRESARFGDVRPEIVAAFKTIVERMNSRAQTSEEAAQSVETWHTKSLRSQESWLKAIRRDFAGLEAEFDVLAEKVRAGDVGEGRVAVSSAAYLSPIVVEIRNLYKQKHGRVYALDNCKGLQCWIDSIGYRASSKDAAAAHIPVNVATEFAANARVMDKEKGGKPYWATDLEKFARAFDAYVSDELEARAIGNQYLAHQGRTGRTVPEGADREVINSAFRELVSDLKTRETERGVALYSVGAGEGSPSTPLARNVLEAGIRRMGEQWPSMPRVSVVNDVADLPCAAKRNCDGLYFNGNVFLVAENIYSLGQFQKVMAHECVLHYSLEQSLGNYGFSKLHEGIQALKKAGDPVVMQLAEDIRRRYGELSPSAETKEIVARAGEYCLDRKGNLKIEFGFMKAVFAGVANFLRDRGIPVPFTNLELQGLMHAAGQWIRTEHDIPGRHAGGVVPAMGALHSFAGIQAENAPIERLRVAREMQLAGVDDREIWKETGWTFGFADGKPRFELPDAGMRVMPENDGPDSTSSATVAGAVQDSAVVAGYPQLGALNADIAITSAAYVEGAYGRDGITALAPLNQIAGIVLHELQHAIQDVEGFAQGGNAGMLGGADITDRVLERISVEKQKLFSGNEAFYRDSVKATQLMGAVKEKYGSLGACVGDDALVQQWWGAIDARDKHPEAGAWRALQAEESLVKRDGVRLSPDEQYHRLAGEVEARLTVGRMSLSPAARAGNYPADEMDVPIAEQIVALRQEVRQQKAVHEGVFSGKILDVNDGLAAQKVGRGPACVLHTLSRLSAPIAIGDVVDIVYKDGRGMVGGLERAGVEKATR